MFRLKSLFAAILLVATLTGVATARILRVPQDHQQIQPAIADAQDGDTILVQPGVYTRIDFQGRAITVASLILTTNDPAYIDSTIIDGENAGPGVVFRTREPETSILRGFTVRNGIQDFGAGIDCQRDTRPRISDMRITRNTARQGSGGVHVSTGARPRFERCLIDSNIARSSPGTYGGGVGVHFGGHPTFVNCQIIGNELITGIGAGGIGLYQTGVTLIDCEIRGNTTQSQGIPIAGGVCVYSTNADTVRLQRTAIVANRSVGNQRAYGAINIYQPPRLSIFDRVLIAGNSSPTTPVVAIAGRGSFDNLTVANNVAEDGGRAFTLTGTDRNNTTIRNSIFVDNSGLCYFGQASFDYNDVVGGRDAIAEGNGFLWGENNLDVDPLFADFDNGDYRLQPDSPCIDAGDPDSEPDPDGTRADIGALYFGREATMEGFVIDARTEQRIDGATIVLTGERDGRKVTRSDDEGYYRFDFILEGEHILEVTRPGYAMNRLDNLVFELDDRWEFNLILHQSEMRLEQAEVNERVELGDSVEVELNFSNAGDTLLEWRARPRLRGEAGGEPWSVVRSYNVGAAVNDDRIEGVVLAWDEFYISGAARGLPHQVYVMNRDGEVVRRFNQVGESVYGMRDLAWDGELIWGSGERDVFGYRPDGELVRRFAGPNNPNHLITWDENRGVLWIGIMGQNIHAYDRDGNRLDGLVNHQGLRINSLAYFPDDPDGHPLYALNTPALGQQFIHRFNPATGDTLRGIPIALDDAAQFGGAFITRDYDRHYWSLLHIANRSRNRGGDQVQVRLITGFTGWMALSEVTGELEVNQRGSITLELTPLDFRAGEVLSGEIVFTTNNLGEEIGLPITLEIEGDAGDRYQIGFARGWNMVSSPVQPAEDDVVAIFAPLVETGQVRIVKDGRGRFYMPEQGFNNIPRWDAREGYQVRVEGICTLELRGLLADAATPIPLARGWNMVAYLPDRPAEAPLALAGIEEQLIIAKDGVGRFYLPEQDFNNLAPLQRGQGYQVKVTEEVELIYPNAERNANANADADIFFSGGSPIYRGVPTTSGNSPKLQKAGDSPIYRGDEGMEPTHFQPVERTGRNMSVLFNGRWKMEDGTGEIGVFAENGLCVGTSSFHILHSAFRIGLAVWGDDPTTEAIDGALEGETLTVKVWDGTKETPLAVNWVEGNGVYDSDGFELGYLTTEGTKSPEIPERFALYEPFPNPFNSSTRFTFSLPEAGLVKLGIYDISGREVQSGTRQFAAGIHIVGWKAEGLSAGTYFVKAEVGSAVHTQKLLLVK
ncbi:MAG: T9SS type A sorting domain-containing protein [Calditrichaeota bacterium]|nr:T9SS type A sorting domain-containing protein [Calditrichota bacterium]